MNFYNTIFVFEISKHAEKFTVLPTSFILIARFTEQRMHQKLTREMTGLSASTILLKSILPIVDSF
jgi:hypothetical protein